VKKELNYKRDKKPAKIKIIKVFTVEATLLSKSIKKTRGN
jgi:hypothetical protein